MKACVVGCGYVGLATGIELANMGHKIRFVDRDPRIVSAISNGEIPFHDPLLSSNLIKGIRNRRISATDNIGEAIAASDYIFLTVQTPLMKSGSVKLKHLSDYLEEIAEAIDKGKIIIIKSGVPPGTINNIAIPILEKFSGLKAGKDFYVAMNPEFYTERFHHLDDLKEQMIVIGASNKRLASEIMKLYQKSDVPKIMTDIETAEIIKLARDGYLATKMSYSNELAIVCEKFGADAHEVFEAIGLDPSISRGYLEAGPGFGGDSIPKAVSTLIQSMETKGHKSELMRAVKKIDDRQPLRIIEILMEEIGDLKGKRIAILGLANRPYSDDVTNSKAFAVAIEILARGANMVAYDPLAISSFIGLLPGIEYASSAREALLDVDGCVIQTPDDEFKRLSKQDFDLMKRKVVIDGRRILSPAKMSKYGVTLRAIGLRRKA